MFDAPIHYVVLKNPPNQFNFDRVKKLIDIYNKIDNSKGPGVVVTVSTSTKYFSTGFDIDYWMEDVLNPLVSADLI